MLIMDCHRHRAQTQLPPDRPHLLVKVYGSDAFRLLKLGSQRAPYDFAQVSNALYHPHCSSVLW